MCKCQIHETIITSEYQGRLLSSLLILILLLLLLFLYLNMEEVDFPGGSAMRCLQRRRSRRWGFDPWVGKIPWRRARQPTPVFLPEKSHGPRSLASCCTWGCKESDTTEATEQAGMGEADRFP